MAAKLQLLIRTAERLLVQHERRDEAALAFFHALEELPLKWHPDVPFAFYVNDKRRCLFDEAEAHVLDRAMDRAFEVFGRDIYEVAKDVVGLHRKPASRTSVGDTPIF